MLGKIPVLLQVTYTTYVLHVLQTAAALSKYEHCNNTCKYEIEPVMTVTCSQLALFHIHMYYYNVHTLIRPPPSEGHAVYVIVLSRLGNFKSPSQQRSYIDLAP